MQFIHAYSTNVVVYSVKMFSKSKRKLTKTSACHKHYDDGNCFDIDETESKWFIDDNVIGIQVQ